MRESTAETTETAETAAPKDRAITAWLSETTALLDECGFGIYLLHMIFLRLFLRYLTWNPFVMGEWTIFVLALGVFLLTAVLVALLRKIPRVNEVL